MPARIGTTDGARRCTRRARPEPVTEVRSLPPHRQSRRARRRERRRAGLTIRPAPARRSEAPASLRHLRTLLGLGLLAAAAGLVVIDLSLPEERAAVVGTVAGVNAGAGDPRDIAAHNSPVLARNPVDTANLVVANRIDTPRFSCALHTSFDAGATWTTPRLPFPEGEEDPPRCYVPTATFEPGGTLHVAFSTLAGPGNRPNAVWLVSSADGGRSFSPPARLLGPLAFQPQIVADDRRPGRLYLTWLQADDVVNLGFARTGNPINVMRTDDGGRTWGAPVRVSDADRLRAVAPTAVVGRDGELFVAYLDLGDDRLDYGGAHAGRGGEPYQGSWTLVLARSLDGGDSWQEAEVDDHVTPTERILVFLPPFPALAVDRASGRLYLAVADGRLGDADVWLWTSSDRGQTFGVARRVNDTAERDGTAQYLPAVGVAPGGRVDVVYYDRRRDGRDRFNHVSLQSSYDRGRRFGGHVRLSATQFDSRIGFGSALGMPDLGSRLAVTSARRRALAVWADTTSGSEASGKQDLSRAVVALSRPAGGRGQVRTAAAASAGAGVVVLLWAASGKRRPRARRRPERAR